MRDQTENVMCLPMYRVESCSITRGHTVSAFVATAKRVADFLDEVG